MAERSFVILYTNQKTKKAKTWHDGTLRFSGNGTRGVLYDDKSSRIDTIHVRSEDIVLGEQLESDRHYILIEEESKAGVTNQNDAPKDQPAAGPIRRGGNKSQIRTGLKKGRGGFVPPRLVAPKDPEPPNHHTANTNCGETKVHSPVRNSNHYASFQRRYNILNQVSPKRTLSDLNKSEMSATSPLILNSGPQISPDRVFYRENSSPLIGLLNKRSLTTSPWSTIGSSQSPGSSKLDSQLDTDIQEPETKPSNHFVKKQIVQNTMQENSFTSHQKRSTTQILALLSKTSCKSHIAEGTLCNKDSHMSKSSPQNRLFSTCTDKRKCSFDTSPSIRPLAEVKGEQLLQWNQQQGGLPGTPGITNLSIDREQSYSSQRSYHNSGSFIADSKNQPDDSHYDLISTPSMVTYMESGRSISLNNSPDCQPESRMEGKPQHIVCSDPEQITMSDTLQVKSESLQVIQREPLQVVESEPQHTLVSELEPIVKECHPRVHNKPQYKVTSEHQLNALDECPDNLTSNIVNEKDSAVSVHEVNTQAELTEVESPQRDVSLHKEEISRQCNESSSQRIDTQMESEEDLGEEGEEDEMDGQGGASFAISFSPLSVIPSDSDSDREEPLCSRENTQQQEEQDYSNIQRPGMSAEVSGSLTLEGKIMVNREGSGETEVIQDDVALQKESQHMEVGEDRNMPTCQTDAKDENSIQEKEGINCKTGDEVSCCLDSSQSPDTIVNEYREKQRRKEEEGKNIRQEGMSQKKLTGQKDSEGFSQKSLGCLELSPDSPGCLFKSSQTNSNWISQNANLMMNSSDIQVGNVKLPVFETSWSEDDSMFDTSPLKLHRQQQQENKGDSAQSSFNSLKCSEKCDSGDSTQMEGKPHRVECSSMEHVEEENVFKNRHFHRYDQFKSKQESDQPWVNEETDSYSVTSDVMLAVGGHTEINCAPKLLNSVTWRNYVPKTEPSYSLSDLPHPSELIKSPRKTEEKDLSEKISERLGSYRMRGSVSGMGAQRQSQRTGFDTKTGPNITLSQVRRGLKAEKIEFQSEEAVRGDWIDKLQVDHKNKENLSQIGSSMNTAKPSYVKRNYPNHNNFRKHCIRNDESTTRLCPQIGMMSTNSPGMLLETEEEVLNNISNNNSFITSGSVTVFNSHDEEICKDSVYGMSRRMFSPDVESARDPPKIALRSQPFGDQQCQELQSHSVRDTEYGSVRDPGKIALGSQPFDDQCQELQSHSVRDTEYGSVRDPGKIALGRQPFDDQSQDSPSYSVRNTEYGSVNSSGQELDTNLKDLNRDDSIENAESVVSKWGKFMPMDEEEEDLDYLNCSYDFNTSSGKINSEPQRRNHNVATSHMAAASDQSSQLGCFRSTALNTPTLRGNADTVTSFNDTECIRKSRKFCFKGRQHSFTDDNNDSMLYESNQATAKNAIIQRNMESNYTPINIIDSSSLDVNQKSYSSNHGNLTSSSNQFVGISPNLDLICLGSSPSLYDSPEQKSYRHNSPASLSLKSVDIELTKPTSQKVPVSENSKVSSEVNSPMFDSPEQKTYRFNYPDNQSLNLEEKELAKSTRQKVPVSASSIASSKFNSPIGQRVPETDISDGSSDSVICISAERRFNPPIFNSTSSPNILIGSKRSLWDDLQFASLLEVENNPTPVRKIVQYIVQSVHCPIQTEVSSLSNTNRGQFIVQYKQRLVHCPIQIEVSTLSNTNRGQSIVQYKQYIFQYKQVLISALRGQYIVQYKHICPQSLISVKNTQSSQSRDTGSPLPPCHCGVSSKLVQVRKEGPNKGRYFYSCPNPASQRCKFFQWADSSGNIGLHHMGGAKVRLTDAGSVTSYFRQHRIMFYCQCQYLQKSMETILAHFKNPWAKQKYQRENKMQRKYFIRLSRKDSSTLYSKDDLWIVSRDLNFDSTCTFLAKSTYYGPTSGNEVEIEPVSKFSPSNWKNEASCHAVLAGNVSSELSYLDNIQDNVQQSCLPILSQLLSVDGADAGKTHKGFQPPRLNHGKSASNIHVPVYAMNELVTEFMRTYSLNSDQGSALRRLAAMFCEDSHSDVSSLLLIHGVFGAGKSFLLSVMVRFLVRVFEVNGSYTPGLPYPWKILISSTTNVAVDRVLMGLLDIGFEDFVRVGSMKKIAKPVLPYSVHATGTESQELKDLQEMMRSGDLSPSEKHNVRQSIEKHKLGENKKRLGNVAVVGVTCASCVAPSLKDLKFPVVILDECSQMTEPASLFPMSKFACEKLVLVGDPKQLDPTIQGSEANHSEGLEQTMFDRLIKMGHIPTLLRTQYRCHPVISDLANTLFYQGQLLDGVKATDRAPVLDILPTLCFYNVCNGQEDNDSSGSFSNEKEADFIAFMIEALVNAGVDSTSIGVITLYKSQMYSIIAKLGTSRNCSQNETKSILVSTVDAFQGGERNIIFLSCVRTNNTGFIDNHKRTNVALTRARHHLFIVGHLNNLEKNQLWGKVISMCRARKDGMQDSEEARHSLSSLLNSLSQGSSSSLPTRQPKRSSRKRKQQEEEEESPPMSLTGQTDESVVSESPVVVSSCETTDEVSRNKCKRRRELPRIDPSLLDSDKENEEEEELPVFDL
ncbi:LOW QUALITY PROTEIN: uncharacterized protein LOC134255841 [Saccostrea cucullata]|uniref:LOW QUALITY PROTEIN: uncharacterized protein LOC134255841 n=1 Tax=Saccostrea cuccullata TaxID=36930 RepID=UPI002ED1CFA7